MLRSRRVYACLTARLRVGSLLRREAGAPTRTRPLSLAEDLPQRGREGIRVTLWPYSAEESPWLLGKVTGVVPTCGASQLRSGGDSFVAMM